MQFSFLTEFVCEGSPVPQDLENLNLLKIFLRSKIPNCLSIHKLMTLWLMVALLLWTLLLLVLEMLSSNQEKKRETERVRHNVKNKSYEGHRLEGHYARLLRRLALTRKSPSMSKCEGPSKCCLLLLTSPSIIIQNTVPKHYCS